MIYHVNGNGYVRTTNTTSVYFPLEICMFLRDYGLSFYFKCYSENIFTVYYQSTVCNGPVYLNISTNVAEYICDAPKIYDYIVYNLYPEDLNGMNCNDLIQEPNSYAQLINECLYDPVFELYRMDTYDGYLWATKWYDDENCNNIMLNSQIIDECVNGSYGVYYHITKCTSPLNTINNKCGFVQLLKKHYIQPLNECNIESETLSYLFTCFDNNPYLYYWNNNSCGSLSNGLSTRIYPISFSCSTVQCDNVLYKTSINDQCNQISMNDTTISSISYIVDECFNYFDSNNMMISKTFHCDETWVNEISYNAPNCDSVDGSWMYNHTEKCSVNDVNRDIIECNLHSTSSNNNYSTYSPTSIICQQ